MVHTRTRIYLCNSFWEPIILQDIIEINLESRSSEDVRFEIIERFYYRLWIMDWKHVPSISFWVGVEPGEIPAKIPKIFSTIGVEWKRSWGWEPDFKTLKSKLQMFKDNHWAGRFIYARAESPSPFVLSLVIVGEIRGTILFVCISSSSVWMLCLKSLLFFARHQKQRICKYTLYTEHSKL
jgi:hypothetical protein